MGMLMVCDKPQVVNGKQVSPMTPVMLPNSLALALKNKGQAVVASGKAHKEFAEARAKRKEAAKKAAAKKAKDKAK